MKNVETKIAKFKVGEFKNRFFPKLFWDSGNTVWTKERDSRQINRTLPVCLSNTGSLTV
jgi:hypothetical protein